MERKPFFNLKILAPYKRTLPEDEKKMLQVGCLEVTYFQIVVKEWNLYSKEVVSSPSIECLKGNFSIIIKKATLSNLDYAVPG